MNRHVLLGELPPDAVQTEHRYGGGPPHALWCETTIRRSLCFGEIEVPDTVDHAR